MTMIRRGFGRPTSEKPQTTPLATTAGPVVQVRLYTAHTIINGSLRLAFNRLSDHLNFGPPVLELGMAELVRLDHPQVHRAQQVAYIQREAIIMALDRLSDDYVATHPALHREKESLDVTADLGHFIVKGTLHLRHGMDLSNWLIDAPLFVPLTAVTIYGDGGQPVHDSLAIINRSTLSAILH